MLLALPRELRDQIYTYVFAKTTCVPFAAETASDWFFFGAARPRCRACPSFVTSPLPTVRSVIGPLLTCRQIYCEAVDIFLKSVTLHIDDPDDIERIASSPPHHGRQVRTSLRHLALRLHLKDTTRDAWMSALGRIPGTFPGLVHVTIDNHMRPPTSYENISDALYLAGPLLHHFPPHLQPPSPALQLDFAYVEDNVLFACEELGRIYHRDALEAHKGVIMALLQDDKFRGYACDLDMQTMLLMLSRIAKQFEQQWLESLRQRRIREQEAQAQAEARVQLEREAGGENRIVLVE